MALTQAQIDALNAAAAGNVIVPGTQNPTVQVDSYPGCNQGGRVGPTDFSKPIDSTKFNTDQCGLVSFYVDTTATSITTARTLVLGGQLGTGRSQVAEDIFGITPAAGGFLADLDLADVVGVDSANFNPTDLFDWLQDIFAAHEMIFQRIDIERTAGTTDLTTLGKIRKYSLKPEGDWEVCNPKIQQNFCDPCLMDDGSRVSYQGFFPTSALNAWAMNIPTGIALTFEMCVYQYENAKNMTICS